MKRFVALFAVICLALIVFVPMSMATPRQDVINQAFYALDTSANGQSNKTINGNYVGDWNWLNNDYNSYNLVKGWYNVNNSCFASDWAYSPEICYSGHSDASFYSDVAYYGYYGAYGRGGQCKYFANLILYRSGADQRVLPNWTTMLSSTQPDLTKAVAGDVIFTYGLGITNHIAIVVQVNRDGSGNVTGLDVIDANYITDTGGANREVIGRHLFGISYLQQYYYIWTGVSYYP